VTILHREHGRYRSLVAGSDLLCPLRGVPKAVALDLHPCWAWKPDLRRAQAAALSAAQDEVDRWSADEGLPGTSTTVLGHCGRNEYGWLLKCRLSASPDRNDVDSARCVLVVEVTADANNRIRTHLAQASCVVES
jgi:hypothetical protein